MRKHLVLKAFIDKDTQQPFSEGNSYESDNEKRVAFLQEEGFLKTNNKKKESKEKAKKKDKV